MTSTHGVAPVAAVTAAVEDAMRSFAKALRAMQLYLPNNPTRAHALEQARKSFRCLWQHTDVLELRIQEAALLWEGRVVYDDAERGSEGLPWIMYRDGLRELSLHDGFERAGLDGLLGLLQRMRTTSPDEDDLVTLLWVADLEGVSYQHVESFPQQGPSVAGDGADGSAGAAGPPLAATIEEFTPVGEGPPPAMIRMEDFDSTLYFLDTRESAYLQDQVQLEYATDSRQGAIAVMFDIVAMSIDDASREEALRILDQLLLEFLAVTDFEMVALVLREAAAARALVGESPTLARALEALPARLSEPLVMAQLLQAIDESMIPPSVSLLETLFTELRPAALRSLLQWLGNGQNSPAQAAIERATLRLASEHTGELARLLDDRDARVVVGAMRVATALATPAAVPPLVRILGGPDAVLRGEAVAALRAIATPGALQAMESALDDSEREVRVAAMRGVAARRHAGALPRLRSAISRKSLRGADLGEKMALLEAFGALCGDGGVGELDSLLNARGLLGAREPAELRACAARALGIVGTPAAITALQRASDAKDTVVRSAVARALRGGT